MKMLKYEAGYLWDYQKTCHDGRTSRLKPCADRRTGEDLIEKGLITLRRVYAEDF
jgi:hypothetical protein